MPFKLALVTCSFYYIYIPAGLTQGTFLAHLSEAENTNRAILSVCMLQAKPR